MQRPIGAPLHHPYPIKVLAFSPDGRMFATADREDRLSLWETESGRPVGPAWQAPDKKPRERYYTLSFTPDSRYLVVDSHEVLRLWEIATGRLVASLPNLGHSWAKDGKWLALIPGDTYEDNPWGAVSVWDVEMRRRRSLAETSTTYLCLDSHPDSRIVAASWDKFAGFWDAAAGRPIGPLLEHPGTLFALHFAPDGERLATCCVDDLARTWEVPRPLEGGAERIRLWIEVLTEHELDDAGKAQRLLTEELENRRRRLAALGGPPTP